jgi:RNA polymerase sigma-70 factor (ECF subfamily)
MAPVTGEALLAAIARDRDRDAFRQLFEAFAPRIKRFACGRGAPPALADEVVQEVMLKLWRKASLFDPARANAGTWIYSIARNCVLDRLRGERHPEIEDDDPNRVPPIAPDEQMEQAEGRHALTRALQELPSAEVDVLRGAYFQGLSMSEIASRDALPLGTVKTRMRNALRRLRPLLGRTNP